MLIKLLILLGADWLQGPYVYSLYHEQYQYTEQTVAILFVTGFTSAGFFSPLVGDWADQKYGYLIYTISAEANLAYSTVDENVPVSYSASHTPRLVY